MKKEDQMAEDAKKGCLGCGGTIFSLIVVCWFLELGGCRSGGPSAADRQFEEIKKDPERLRKWIDRVNDLKNKK